MSATLVKVQKDDPRSPKELLAFARKAHEAEQRDIAINHALLAAKRLDGEQSAHARTFAARVLGEKGLWAESKTILEELLATHGDLAEALCWRGWARFQLHDDQGALEDLNRAVELDPNLTEAWYRRGSVEKALHSYDSAADAFGHVVDDQKLGSQALMARAGCWEKLERIEDAKNDYRRDIAEHDNPRAAEALERHDFMPDLHAKVILAKHYVLSRDFERAETLLDEIFDQAPAGKDLVEAWMQRSTCAYSRDKASAIEPLKKAVEAADEGNAEPQRKLAQTFYNLERDEEALAAYEKAIQIDPENSTTYRGLASVHLVSKDDQAVLDALDQCLKHDPFDSRAHYLRGVALVHLGQHDEAQEQLEVADGMGEKKARERRLQEYGQTTSGDAFARAVEHLNRSAWEAAVEAFDAVIPRFEQEVVAPGDYAHRHLASAISNRGYARYRAGDAENAVDDLRKAAEVRPTFADPWLNLGNALKSLGRFDEAMEAHTRVTELNPRNPDGHYNRAHVYMKMGQPEEALADFDRAIEIGYAHVRPLLDAYFNRGRCLMAMDRLAEAEASFREMANRNDFHGSQLADAVGRVRAVREELRGEPGIEDSYSYRFYGVRPNDWREGANCHHGYRIQFQSPPDDAALKTIAGAWMLATHGKVDTTCGPWKWSGKWAHFNVGEIAISQFDDHFRALSTAFRALNRACPLAEVVYLNAKTLSDGEAHEDWSAAMQPVPDRGPDFGRRGEIWITEISDTRSFEKPAVNLDFDRYVEAARKAVHRREATELAKSALASDEFAVLPIPAAEVPRRQLHGHLNPYINSGDYFVTADTGHAVVVHLINGHYRVAEFVRPDGGATLISFPDSPADIRGGLAIRKDGSEALLGVGPRLYAAPLNTGTAIELWASDMGSLKSVAWVGQDRIAVLGKSDTVALLQRSDNGVEKLSTVKGPNGELVPCKEGKVLIATSFGFGPDVQVLGIVGDTVKVIAESSVDINGYSVREQDGRILASGPAGDLELLNLDKAWDTFAAAGPESATEPSFDQDAGESPDVPGDLDLQAMTVEELDGWLVENPDADPDLVASVFDRLDELETGGTPSSDNSGSPEATDELDLDGLTEEQLYELMEKYEAAGNDAALDQLLEKLDALGLL